MGKKRLCPRKDVILIRLRQRVGYVVTFPYYMIAKKMVKIRICSRKNVRQRVGYVVTFPGKLLLLLRLWRLVQYVLHLHSLVLIWINCEFTLLLRKCALLYYIFIDFTGRKVEEKKLESDMDICFCNNPLN